jgi:hypothetical protein
MRMQEEWAARAAAEEESKREAAKRVAEAAEARAAEEELMRAARQSEEAFMNRYRAKWHMDDPITRKMEAETSHESEVDSDHAHAEAAHLYADATSRPALRLPPLMPKSKSAPQLANMWVSKPVRSKRGGVMLPATEVSVRLAARHSNKCARRSTWLSCIRPASLVHSITVSCVSILTHTRSVHTGHGQRRGQRDRL